jgi:TolB protein
MRDNERPDTDEFHDTTIAQLLTHLQQLRRAVPVNYRLKAELKEKLLQRMKELDANRTSAAPKLRIKRRKVWWLASGVIALTLAALIGFWGQDSIKMIQPSFVTVPLKGSVEQVDLNSRGDRVAFVAEDAKLYTRSITDASEKENYQLPKSEGKYNALAWSYSDERIALIEQIDGTSRLWMLDVPKNGLHSSRLLREEKGVTYSTPSWAPNNTEIAYTRVANGKAEIWVNSTVSFQERKITEGTQPDWAPDGNQLAFVDGGTVSILNLATGETKPLGQGEWPSWQSTDRLTYTTAEGKLVQVRLDVEPSETDELAVPHAPGEKLVRANWAKNGKDLLIAHETKQMFVFSIAARK